MKNEQKVINNLTVVANAIALATNATKKISGRTVGGFIEGQVPSNEQIESIVAARIKSRLAMKGAK